MIGEAYSDRIGYEKEARLEQGPLRGAYLNETVSSPVVRTGISAELQNLRDLVNAAHEYATMLEQKTAPFRRIRPQCAEKDGKKLCTDGSELTEDLMSQNERLQTLCSRMSVLIDEIDL